MSTPVQRSTLKGDNYVAGREFESTGHPKTAEKLVKAGEAVQRAGKDHAEFIDHAQQAAALKSRARTEGASFADREAYRRQVEQTFSAANRFSSSSASAEGAKEDLRSSVQSARRQDSARTVARAALDAGAVVSAGLGGAATGTAVIPVPIVGTVIGAAAGAAAGGVGVAARRVSRQVATELRQERIRQEAAARSAPAADEDA